MAFSVLLALSACSTVPPAADPPSRGPMAIYDDFRREQHKDFTDQERGMIAAARRHLVRLDKRPLGASDDAYYRVRHTEDGCEVFVIYVTGYDGDKPQTTPCIHNEVLMKKDGSLVKALVGPECWP